jgi:uncharacterized repeat protein (TIGR04138 family)
MSKRQRSVNELEQIAKEDGRYRVEALLFVLQSLEYLVNNLEEHRHVSGEELSDGVREFAQKCFGLMARTVLAEWGITKTDDVGKIVYLLIDRGWMNRTEEDRLEDFFDVFDFTEAFDRDYDIPHVDLPKPNRKWLVWKGGK